MVPEVLEGMLWLARLGLRSHHGSMRAGHGYADPGFRPSALPFASLIGPLKIELEPERDLPVPGGVLVQLPGFVVSAPRTAEAVAAGMTLTATFDRSDNATIVLGAGDFATEAAAAAVCADIETAFRTAAAANAFVDAGGSPVTDTDRVAELEQIACRWDAAASAIVLSSGRRGYLDQIAPSTVDPDGGTALEVLGLDAPSQHQAGRHVRHRAPAPKGYVLDVRFDLWAANQRDLGYLIDALIRTVPTRTRMVTRPGLLVFDLAPGDRVLRLLDRGEPTLGDSLLHLEAADGFSDRTTGSSLEVVSTATAELDPPRLRFTGDGAAGRVLRSVPSVPDPRRADSAAPEGAAITLDLRLEGGVDGQSGRILSLEQGGHRLLRLDFSILATPVLVGDLTASADLRDPNGNINTASTTRRAPLDDLNAGMSVHVTLVAATGTLSIHLDGEAQDLANPDVTPVAPSAAPGAPFAGDGLSILLGNEAGNPVAFELRQVHLFGRPLSALDPHLRASASAASRFRPGDPVTLGESDNGYMTRGETEGFYVRAVFGDRIELDRPVSRNWRRGATLVHARDCFLHQTGVKRRDDLMNRLYRYSIGYRVSTLLEQPDTAIDGGLVLEARVDLEIRNHPRRVGSAAPGAHPVDAPPVGQPQTKQALPRQE